jgi:IclR family acetate operon transcriptional repressor
MAVKRSQSALRTLAVLENVATHQPIGMTELAHLVEADRNAVHRALLTLADAGWVRPATGKSRGWELTPRLNELAEAAHGSHDLRMLARPVLQRLRDETGETVTLNVPERGQFVVLDVVESRQALRVVISIGAAMSALGSATGRALLPYMSPKRRAEFVGGDLDEAEIQAFAAGIANGYSVSSGIQLEGFTSIGAPVFGADSQPVGAVIVTGPTSRFRQEEARVGGLVAAAAGKLSRGPAPEPNLPAAQARPAVRAGRGALRPRPERPD